MKSKEKQTKAGRQFLKELACCDPAFLVGYLIGLAMPIEDLRATEGKQQKGGVL